MTELKKKIITKFSVLLILGVLLIPTISAYAMDSRVISSDKQINYDRDSNTAYVSGQVTANENHYCSVKHFRLGTEIAYSGRRWNTGWAYNSTAANRQDCPIVGAVADGVGLYYGF